MNDDNFEGPPTTWVVLTVIGGIATALGLIAGLEYLSDRLSPHSGSMCGSRLISDENVSSSQDVNF